MAVVNLTPPAKKEFKTLKKKNPLTHSKIRKKLESLSSNPKAGKLLLGDFKGVRSLRVRNYRILYEFIDGNIFIYSIKHRKDVYR